MRASTLFWTFGVATALLAAGLLTGGLQELANAQVRSKAPPSSAPATVDKVRVATAQPTPAQQDASSQAGETPAAASWSSRCSSATRQSVPECFIEQTAILTQTGQLVASMSVRLPPDTRQPVMMIQVPVGLFLPAGIAVQVDDGAPTRLEVQTCDLKGCYAGHQIPAELLSAMKSGRRLAVVFQNLSKQNIVVPLTLAQFGESYQRIQ